MSIKVTPDKFPEIIEAYNAEGKTAAYDLIRSCYGIKNPTCVIKRMKSDPSFGYDDEADRFNRTANTEDDIFMNLDTLCKNRTDESTKKDEKVEQNERVQAMESMIHSLISDRLLELSKYVLMDPISKKILIDKSSMKADGYQVLIS